MNAVVPLPDQRKSVLLTLSDRYGMEPQAFEATLRGTVFPGNGTREEFAAFMLVAKEYRLNPITRQIYAFPKKGGGIIPVVSVDGWAFLINEHPAFDGMEFKDEHVEGELVSTTCLIYRKDRRVPVSVTEYLSECIRNTDPWKMKHRMLRHKAMIQCARYAFAFSGIFDEDEAERFSAGPLITRQGEIISALPSVPPPAPPAAQIEHQAAPAADASGDLEDQLNELHDKLSHAKTRDEVEEFYGDFDAEAVLSAYPEGVELARSMKQSFLDKLTPTQADPPKDAGAATDDFPGNGFIEVDAKPENPVKAYRDKLQHILKTAETRQQLEKFWFDTSAERDACGASAEARAKWQSAKNQLASDLPHDHQVEADI